MTVTTTSYDFRMLARRILRTQEEREQLRRERLRRSIAHVWDVLLKDKGKAERR